MKDIFLEIAYTIYLLIKSYPITFILFVFSLYMCYCTVKETLTINELQQIINDIKSSSDTVYTTKLDTFFLYRPETIKTTVIKHDTIKCDTVKLWYEKQDSVPYIQIPIEQKEYKQDSLYHLWISGYKTNLDSIHIYSKTDNILINNNTVITKYKNKHWSLGPSVNIGYDPINSNFTQSIGISLNYSVLRW